MKIVNSDILIRMSHSLMKKLQIDLNILELFDDLVDIQMIMFSLGYSCFNNPSMNSYPKINGSDMTKITKTLGKVLLDGNISFDSLTPIVFIK